MVDHKIRQLLTIDENDTFVDQIYEKARILRKGGCGDQYTFAGFLAFETPSELLYGGTAHGTILAFGLDIDDIQPEFVFVDDPIDSLVAALANGFGDTGSASSVSHGNQQIDDDLFEKLG